jgi:hypothetical protein
MKVLAEAASDVSDRCVLSVVVFIIYYFRVHQSRVAVKSDK